MKATILKRPTEDVPVRRLWMRPINLVSLFSGIGAFEKALDNLSVEFNLVNFCEFDKYAVKSYCAIHGVDESKNLGDITKVDETKLAKDIDVLTYGFPCQDISLSGKQKGMFNDDGSLTRSGLFFEALRIVEATKPKIAIAENVKNLTSKKFAEQFKLVLESLGQAGYNNYWKVLNAKDYGVPQNRERVFIVSIRKDIDNGVFSFPQGYPLNVKLSDLLENTVDPDFYIEVPFNEYPDHTCRTIKNQYFKNSYANFIRKTAMGATGVQIQVREATKSGYMEDSNVRKLTPKECFRLMGFDDESFHKAEAVNSNTQLYKQAGNSIAVPVAENIFLELIRANILTDCGKTEARND